MQPPVLRSPVALTFGLAHLSLPGGVTQPTRGFNGMAPGPTIRTAPGQTLRLSLSNALGGPLPPSARNEFGLFNASSLHTHGLHVSPAQDDAFRRVPPGETSEFEYALPVSHMGGTHWYHPHAHGASTLQVGGGALGLLIVDDPPGVLPPQVASLPERHLIVSDLRPASLAHVAARSEAACRRAAASEGGAGGEGCHEWLWTREVDVSDPWDVLMLVNGVHEPRMALEAGQWYRFRMLFGSAGGAAGAARGSMMGRQLGIRQLAMDHSDWHGADLRPRILGCETLLLAKDGVYLHSAPRRIAFGFMSAGNRADWLVRCPSGEHALTDDESGATLALIEARRPNEAEASPPSAPIEPFSVARPCYLADLRAAPEVAASHSFTLEHMTFAVKTDGRSEAFPGLEQPAATLPVGAVAEIAIGGTSTMHHVFHMHVNPFQIQDAPTAHTRERAANYFEAGDWHDTLRMPVGGDMMAVMNAPPVRARFQTDTFTGTVPVHCHYLVHEDLGMLATVRIQGDEGATSGWAQRLDARCYRSPANITSALAPGVPAVVPPASQRVLGGGGIDVGGGLALVLLALLLSAGSVLIALRGCGGSNGGNELL